MQLEAMALTSTLHQNDPSQSRGSSNMAALLFT